MNFENQGVIKRLADQYGPENLAVVLGNSEASGVEVFAETVIEGDPSYAGPLAGVSLKIPVYHVLEEDVMAVVPEAMREEKLQLSSLVRCCRRRGRNSNKPLKKPIRFVALNRLAPTYCPLYAFARRLSRASQLGIFERFVRGF